MDPAFTIEQDKKILLEGYPTSTNEEAAFGADKAVEVGASILTLDDALSLGVKHSRTYQSQKEQVFLEALNLTLARHRFTPIFSAGASETYQTRVLAVDSSEIKERIVTHDTQFQSTVAVDFSKYAKAELLGDGSARQNLRKLEDDLLVAQSELKMAETKLAGSERLRAKDFLTKTEYENDKLTVEKATLKGKTAKTALDLFIKYEFTKSAEEFLSKYDEALQALERA